MTLSFLSCSTCVAGSQVFYSAIIILLAYIIGVVAPITYKVGVAGWGCTFVPASAPDPAVLLLCLFSQLESEKFQIMSVFLQVPIIVVKRLHKQADHGVTAMRRMLESAEGDGDREEETSSDLMSEVLSPCAVCVPFCSLFSLSMCVRAAPAGRWRALG